MILQMEPRRLPLGLIGRQIPVRILRQGPRPIRVLVPLPLDARRVDPPLRPIVGVPRIRPPVVRVVVSLVGDGVLEAAREVPPHRSRVLGAVAYRLHVSRRRARVQLIHLAALHQDVRGAGAVVGVGRVGAADVGHFHDDVGQAAREARLVPHRDAHVRHAVAAQLGELIVRRRGGGKFQPPGVDGDLVVLVGAAGDAAGRVVGLLILIFVLLRRVVVPDHEIAFAEETKGDVVVANRVDSGRLVERVDGFIVDEIDRILRDGWLDVVGCRPVRSYPGDLDELSIGVYCRYIGVHCSREDVGTDCQDTHSEGRGHWESHVGIWRGMFRSPDVFLTGLVQSLYPPLDQKQPLLRSYRS